MTIQQLTYALSLEKYGNFRSAASNLGISQPGLSIQIKRLEELTGLLLFDRSGKRVTPTAKGKVFLEKAQLLINESSQLKQLARRLADDKGEVIRIGIIPTLSPYLLPLFIDDFIEHNPHIRLEVKELMTDQIVSNVKRGALDGGIISTPINSSVALETTALFYEEIMAFVAQDHPLFAQSTIDPRQIEQQDLWLLTEGNCFRDQVDKLCHLDDLSNPDNRPFGYESNSIEGLCRVVESQGGVTFIPALSTIHIGDDRADMVKPLSGKKQVREVSTIHLPHHIKVDQLNLLSEHVSNHVPRHMRSPKDAEVVSTKVNV